MNVVELPRDDDPDAERRLRESLESALAKARAENVVLRNVHRQAVAFLNAPYLDEHRVSLGNACAEARDFLSRCYS